MGQSLAEQAKAALERPPTKRERRIKEIQDALRRLEGTLSYDKPLTIGEVAEILWPELPRGEPTG